MTRKLVGHPWRLGCSWVKTLGLVGCAAVGSHWPYIAGANSPDAGICGSQHSISAGQQSL